MKRRSQTSTQQVSKLQKSHTKPQQKQPPKSKLTKSHHNNTNQPQLQKQRKYEKQLITIPKTQKKTKKKIEDYIMIDGNIYKADTHTDRLEVSHFVNRIKREAIYEKCVGGGVGSGHGNGHGKERLSDKQQYHSRLLLRQSKEGSKMLQNQNDCTINVEEIVRNLPLQQKFNLMKQLEKQFDNNPQFNQQINTHSNQQKQHKMFIEVKKQEKQKNQDPILHKQFKPKDITQDEQNKQKLSILNLKLQNLQQELNNKRQTQIQKINKLFYEGQLTASQRKMKITGIDKVKDRKLKLIKCTRNLFYTLLFNKFEADMFRKNGGGGGGGSGNGNGVIQVESASKYIDDAINQLDSFSDVDANPGQQPNNSFSNNYSINLNNNTLNLSLGGSLNMKQKLSMKKPNQIQNKYQTVQYQHVNIRKTAILKTQQQEQNNLDLQYNDLIVQEEVQRKDGNLEERVEISDKKNLNQQSLLISPDKSAEKQEKQKQIQVQQKFECNQQVLPLARRLQIPLLLTKQKVEQLQWQKKAKAIQRMRIEIDKKISFQMGQTQLQTNQQNNQIHHFTTLADINGFIVALYEYIIKKDLRYPVQKLNMAYGKQTVDKLQILQQKGMIENLEYQPVLNQSHFNGFSLQIALNGKRFNQFQKIHNKAVFDNFNMHLNAYRPYFELDGQVYPWFVSEKGLTFYQINQQNIQQVFEKTKIKVLEQCSILCGILPRGIEIQQCPEIVKEKNNENFQKQEKISLIENYGKWGLKILDYDTMVRLLLAEQVLLNQVLQFVNQFKNF